MSPEGNSPARNAATQRVRWRDSLFVRVMVLCGVLLLCLLGSVAVITRYYFLEVIAEMETRTNHIVDSLFFKFEENPEISYEDLASDMMGLHEDVDIRINDYTGDIGPARYSRERDAVGQTTAVARVPIRLADRTILMTATVTVQPQTEILRAFKNKYMLALTTGFVLTLAMMVYVIARALRPLTKLSDTCAAIAAGDLRSVSTQGASGEIRALEETFNQMVHSLQEKELVEAKLRQAQRLSALGNLAAGVAHDVRNPLNAIKLLSSHALDALDGEEESRAAKPLRTIRDEVARLEGIVSSFLSLAKESELAPEPYRVDTLLAECVRLFQKDAEGRQVRLDCELRAGDRTLVLDPKQMTRAVLNVLLNALEASPAGGRVRLTSRLTDRTCEIEIRDDGAGLAREALERVFDPYYTTKPGGTGLGLSITRGIIEEHGGMIEIYGAEGQGCQVLITLPFEPGKAP